MADFCHDYDPGGLGCPQDEVGCPSDCVGDFTQAARDCSKTLKPGFEIQLGLCEGCGGYLFLVRQDDGSFTLEHCDMAGNPLPELTRVWEPIEEE